MIDRIREAADQPDKKPAISQGDAITATATEELSND